MRLEFLDTIRVVQQSERDWLQDHHWPTENWKIWIGHYGGDCNDENWSRTWCGQFGPEPTNKVGGQYCNVRVTTMVIGQFCAHLGYSSVTDFPGYQGISLYQLRPPGRFDLDTYSLPSMSDEYVLFLHEAFARESKPMLGGGAPELP